ncbi:hypothetical protein RchiOBHm_Chr2g0156841 [Rosa chinensis]|uniref:Uncharacterized protein n=1 Tax=Rosa chinensis TaxID=74649 RepID=A0A2P6S1K1_ROSCH|nr:hypothetical protein RchiOBHm_Chr2g0156841 [Rosa chinensis]
MFLLFLGMNIGSGLNRQVIWIASSWRRCVQQLIQMDEEYMKNCMRQACMKQGCMKQACMKLGTNFSILEKLCWCWSFGERKGRAVAVLAFLRHGVEEDVVSYAIDYKILLTISGKFGLSNLGN